MPSARQVTLPDAALNHMSDIAKGKLPPTIQPSNPNFVWDNPLTNNDSLQGSAGKADVFVFDVGAEIASGAVTMNEFIYGFEPGLDQIAVVNAPQNWNPAIALPASASYGDPAISDGIVGAAGATANVPNSAWVLSIHTVDSGSTRRPDITVSHDYGIDLLNGQHVTVTDPWLLP